MDNKFYVSYEVARLLKEKGYDTPTNSVYHLNLYEKNFIKQLYPKNWNEYEESSIISAPTKTEAIDWLESKGLIIDTNFYISRGKWSAHINRKDSWAYVALGEYYLTRLEAEEAAIIKACELL